MENNYLDAFLLAFSNLNYRPKDGKLDFDEFLSAGCKALRLSGDMDEAVIACKMIYVCLLDWKKLEEEFEKNKKLFLESVDEGGLYLHPISEKEAKGTTWLTNATRASLTSVDLTSEEGFLTSFNKKGYYPSAKGTYRLEYDRDNKNKMRIVNEVFEPLVDIVMDEECDIHLENNKTPYALVPDEYGYLNIYRKSHLDSLKGAKVRRKDRVAEIIWGVTNDEAPYIGLARLKTFGEEDEIFALLAMSTFILFERYMDENCPIGKISEA